MKSKTQTIVAFAPTKKRTHFSMVGIEIDPNSKTAYVRLAKIWPRSKMNDIAAEVKQLYDKIQWEITYAEQTFGQSILRDIQTRGHFLIFPITTQKNLKDPENIDKIAIMDQIEMTQFLLSLKQDHKIQFPPVNPKHPRTKDMESLIKETEMFTEIITEQGSASYFAPGDELDGSIKALMIACFGGKSALQDILDEIIIVQGSTQPNKPKLIVEDMEETVKKLFAHGGNDPKDYESGIVKYKKEWV